jgi:rSAM/selenodomain-associated transferase 1
MDGAVAVIAKSPAPGAVKTRLCPPLSLVQAAGLAEAALRDTLAAVAGTRAHRKLLVLDGVPGPWLPHGFEVIEQRGRALDERLAAAFVDLQGPTLIVGMDTPQLSAAQLEHGLSWLKRLPAVLGPAADGGYWAIGLRRAEPAALLGIPMSSEYTLAAQRMRLRALGLAVAELETLRDVDTFADAIAVAAEAPGTQFARALGELQPARAAA